MAAVEQSDEDKVQVTIKRENTDEPMFAQVARQLEQGNAHRDGPLAVFRNHKPSVQPFEVGFEGVRVIDRGGPFREVMAQIYEELRDGKVSLLHRLDGSELFMINRVIKEED